MVDAAHLTIYCKNLLSKETVPVEATSSEGDTTLDESTDVLDATPSGPRAAFEIISSFLTSANEYQFKTENDFLVVLSLKEETLSVRLLCVYVSFSVLH